MTSTIEHTASRTAPAPGVAYTGRTRSVAGETVREIAAAQTLTYHVPLDDSQAIVHLLDGDVGGWIGDDVHLHDAWVEPGGVVTGSCTLTRSVVAGRVHGTDFDTALVR